MADYEEFRIWNRHLSESECRRQFCSRTGRDERDLADSIWREREQRNERYREIDGY
jgi:hypothetical protein